MRGYSHCEHHRFISKRYNYLRFRAIRDSKATMCKRFFERFFKYFLAKMVRKCQVCKKLDTFHPELSFHRFPVDPEKKKCV
ncbi:hypothetical protein NQ317_010820 [Molorchus minor]|uniref:Uncharacterized protein n=1 Tax=Molorchus minor TaxID=1323400 RepID=A0ABQ9IQ15_9CUCU|nr:hypothetical protein NQ317_010820 [Molorchus minor]